jgi:hypothetical protein
MKTKYLAVSVSLVLVFVVFLRQAEAVVPPPDGGYPGFTTAEGTNALKILRLELRIQQPVGIRSLRIAQAATTLALGLEPSYSTTESKTRLPVWLLF